MNMDGIIGKLEKHAELVGIIASVWSRTKEGDMPQGIIGHFTDWSPNGQGIGAILKADTDLTYVQNKLFKSTHLYTFLVKVGIGLWAAAELDLPYVGKYKTLGEKLLRAGVISALGLPGSSGANDTGNPPMQRNSRTGSPSSSYQIGGAF